MNFNTFRHIELIILSSVLIFLTFFDGLPVEFLTSCWDTPIYHNRYEGQLPTKRGIVLGRSKFQWPAATFARRGDGDLSGDDACAQGRLARATGFAERSSSRFQVL